MDPASIDPIALMVDIIKEHAPENIWIDSPVQGYRNLGNTNRGEIGEEFIRQYLRASGIAVSDKGWRADLIDMVIAEHSFEVKTASLGVNGTFQFNHVRLDRDYHYLLCLGLCPHEIVFNLWNKAEVTGGQAGRLVSMAQDQAVTAKLTKKLTDMRPIAALPVMIHTLFNLGDS
jgi:hypothetical protein